jgi:hypothetical protein
MRKKINKALKKNEISVVLNGLVPYSVSVMISYCVWMKVIMSRRRGVFYKIVEIVK